MHNHISSFGIGETVYLKTDQDQRPRIVVALTIRPGGSESIFYELGCGPESSFHFEIEMDAHKNENLKLGIE